MKNGTYLEDIRSELEAESDVYPFLRSIAGVIESHENLNREIWYSLERALGIMESFNDTTRMLEQRLVALEKKVAEFESQSTGESNVV